MIQKVEKPYRGSCKSNQPGEGVLDGGNLTGMLLMAVKRAFDYVS